MDWAHLAGISIAVHSQGFPTKLFNGSAFHHPSNCISRSHKQKFRQRHNQAPIMLNAISFMFVTKEFAIYEWNFERPLVGSLSRLKSDVYCRYISDSLEKSMERERSLYVINLHNFSKRNTKSCDAIENSQRWARSMCAYAREENRLFQQQFIILLTSYGVESGNCTAERRTRLIGHKIFLFVFIPAFIFGARISHEWEKNEESRERIA